MPLTLRVPLLGDCTDEASRRPAAAIESLDYEQATNQVFLRKQKRQEAGSEQRHLYGCVPLPPLLPSLWCLMP
jgi:hypothetical protein